MSEIPNYAIRQISQFIISEWVRDKNQFNRLIDCIFEENMSIENALARFMNDIDMGIFGSSDKAFHKVHEMLIYYLIKGVSRLWNEEKLENQDEMAAFLRGCGREAVC
jgi:hypothetical protein